MNFIKKITKVFKKEKESKKEKTYFELQTNIYHEIQELERKLNETTNLKDKNTILNAIKEKKEQLKKINNENPKLLQYQIKELNNELEKANTLNQEAKALVRYYETILKKYESKIAEEKTADKIQELVNFNSIQIEMFVNSLKNEDFDFDTDYIKILGKLFKIVKEEFYIIRQKMPVKFWLNASDILLAKAGDSLDIAILITAIMHALGDYNAKIFFVELSNYDTFAYVKTKFKRTEIIFDVFNFKSLKEGVNIEEYLPYGKKINKIIYEFNKFEFEQ